MESVIAILKYVGLGFVAFIGLIFVIPILFGRSIEKKWSVEAKFKDAKNRKTGELELKKQRFKDEKDTDFQLKAKCSLRHAGLHAGQRAQILIDNIVAMEGIVERDGRLLLREDAWTGNIDIPQPGKTVTVSVDGRPVVSAELYTFSDQKISTVASDAPDPAMPRTAKILKTSSTKIVGLAMIGTAAIAGYLAWTNNASTVAMIAVSLIAVLGLYMLFSKTTNILYIDNGKLGWYSRFNRQVYAEEVPIDDIQSVKIKPYEHHKPLSLGKSDDNVIQHKRAKHYEFVLGLEDGYEVVIPQNLFDGNIVRSLKKHLLAALQKRKPSIEYIEEDIVYGGRPTNRVRLSTESE